MANIRDYHRNKGKTIILVSHSMDEIARNVDRILVLKNAHVLMQGNARGGVRPGRGTALRRSGRAADHPDRYGIEASGRGHRPGCLYGGGAGASAPCPAEGGSGMLKDITLGQYFPGNSIAHKLDPRTKILLVTLYIIALFSAKGLDGLRCHGGDAGRVREGVPCGPAGAGARAEAGAVYHRLHRHPQYVLHPGHPLPLGVGASSGSP